MNLSAIAVRRPVFTVMLMAGLLIMGWTSFKRLPVDLFPDVAFPIITVTVPYPGASPADVEGLVVKPLEDALSSLNGIDRVQSAAREGLAQVTLMYKLEVDIKAAAEDLRERVARVRSLLPHEISDPIIERVDMAAAPIVTYTLRGGSSLAAAHAYAEDVLGPELEQLMGVAAVQVRGGARREIQVELDRSRLDALHLSPLQVVQRLRAENTNLPAGHFEEGGREVNVRLLAEFKDVDQVRDTIVAASGDGSVVRLRDVANVIDGFEERRTMTRVNGAEAVTLDVRKQSGTNTVEVARAIEARMSQLSRQLPDGMVADLVVDQSTVIKDNAKGVEEDLVFGAAMAVLVVLLFMLDVRSTIICSLALPTSVIGTFFIIYVLGYSLNSMTLIGLSLSIGLLIDDAIVVRENIWKHLEMGKSPRQAALDGTKEISLSVTATTLSVIAVFGPIAFMNGMMGAFLHQFGMTIAAAVALSLFVAFTLDPMLSARFSRSLSEPDRFHKLKAPFEWVHKQFEQTYRAILYFSVHHKFVVALATLGTLVLTGYTARMIGQEFMYAEDHGQFLVEAELPAGTSLAETARLTRDVEQELLAHPEVRTLVATIGVAEQANVINWLVLTSQKQARKLPLSEIKEFAQKTVSKLHSTKVSVLEPPGFEGGPTGAPIIIHVCGEDYTKLMSAADQVLQTLRATSGLQDVQLRFSPGRPEVGFDLDRKSAAEYAVTASDVAMALRTAIAGENAGALRQPGQHSDVSIRARLDRQYRGDAQSLEALTLQTPNGRIPLNHIAKLRRTDGPQQIERLNKQRQITIWATPHGRGLGEVAADFRPRIAQLALPDGVSIAYDGMLRMMDENNDGMGVAMLLGVAFIYLVLASLFESFIHPVTIMFSMPLAMVGAIIALFLTRSTLAMSGMIGIILLMGLVTKNAILLLDRAIVRVREHGATPLEAILAAGPERLRPILMTSAAMVFGMLPTAFSSAAASESRAPMAIAIVGGVVSSTLLSLIVVPVVYLAIEGVKSWLRQRWLSWQRSARMPADEDEQGQTTAETA